VPGGNRGDDRTFRGFVRDPSRRVVPGEKVTVVEHGTNRSRVMNAVAEGEFAFPALPAGDEKLGIDVDGFKKYVHKVETASPSSGR
jgi:hypothetical protein